MKDSKVCSHIVQFKAVRSVAFFFAFSALLLYAALCYCSFFSVTPTLVFAPPTFLSVALSSFAATLSSLLLPLSSLLLLSSLLFSSFPFSSLSLLFFSLVEKVQVDSTHTNDNTTLTPNTRTPKHTQTLPPHTITLALPLLLTLNHSLHR